MHYIYYDNTQSDIKNLSIKKEQNGYDNRKKLQFEVQIYKSETGRNSLLIRYRGPLIWNSLSNELTLYSPPFWACHSHMALIPETQPENTTWYCSGLRFSLISQDQLVFQENILKTIFSSENGEFSDM